MKSKERISMITSVLIIFVLFASACNASTPVPTQTSPTSVQVAPTSTKTQQSADTLTILIEVSTSSDWTSLNILDPLNILSAKLEEVSGDTTNQEITRSVIALAQPIDSAEGGKIVSVSGMFQVKVSNPLHFSLDKGCIGKTTIRVSSVNGDDSTLIFEYEYKKTETMSGCDTIQFVLNPSDLTMNLDTQEPTPTEVAYSLDADSDYMEGAQMFDEGQAFQHIEYLASDDLQGRLIGSPGSIKAGNYIADYFAKNGLLPAGVNSSYFQPFTTTITVPVNEPVLSMNSPVEHTYKPHYDYSPRLGRFIGTGEASGSVIWMGQCNPSDFNSQLTSKIVLCGPRADVPIQQAVTTLIQYKVGGLLVYSDVDEVYARSGYGFQEMIDAPVFMINRSIAEDLLAVDQHSLDNIDQMDVFTTLSATVSISSSYETREAQGRNVLGLLPGTDPTLKDEYIIIGAHYDHVGTDPDGAIFNGANDNASGTAVIMEIVRLWQSQGIKPKRSILFVAWDGEEMGYKGSLYYLSDPLYPLESLVGYINVDSIGVGNILYVYGQGEMADLLTNTAELFGISPGLRPQAAGDDIPFADMGIQTATYMVDPDPDHYFKEMHTPDDDPGIIQLDWLHEIGVMSAYSLYIAGTGN
jgi:hypothetical protein